MISWIVATHDPTILMKNLVVSLPYTEVRPEGQGKRRTRATSLDRHQEQDLSTPIVHTAAPACGSGAPNPSCDEIIVALDPPSIAAAYNEGQRRAIHPLRVYVHHDVQVLDLPRLRGELLEHVTPERGMVGLIGSRTDRLPWWDGDLLGSVFDQRIGHLDNGPGGECAQLDGVLLATVQDVTWDESIPGFHGYDYDMCRQMTERGLPNFCLTGGKEMVRHNTTSGRDPDHLTGWVEALSRLREKWGGQDQLG